MNSAIYAEINHKKYKQANQETTKILENFKINIPKKELTMITGSSGSGKSTLLRILSTIDSDFDGKLYFDGKLVAKSNTQMAKIRREKIGFVFQNYELIDELTLLENCALPLQLQGWSKHESLSKAKETIENSSFAKDIASMLQKYPRELSGGQQQRASIIRAAIKNPDIVFADEPTGSLDRDNALQVRNLFEDLLNKGTTIVLVTHDPELYKQICHNHITLHAPTPKHS